MKSRSRNRAALRLTDPPWTWRSAHRTEPAASIIGIDPGLQGGLAQLGVDGSLRRTSAMPTVTRPDAPDEGQMVDAATVCRLLLQATSGREALVVIEHVWGRGGNSAKSNFAFGGAYFGALAGVQMAMAQNPRMELARVAPRTWQGVVIPDSVSKASLKDLDPIRRAESKDTKTAAKHQALLRHRQPESLTASRRCTAAHDGICDAICIAHWARMVRCPEPDESESDWML